MTQPQVPRQVVPSSGGGGGAGAGGGGGHHTILVRLLSSLSAVRLRVPHDHMVEVVVHMLLVLLSYVGQVLAMSSDLWFSQSVVAPSPHGREHSEHAGLNITEVLSFKLGLWRVCQMDDSNVVMKCADTLDTFSQESGLLMLARGTAILSTVLTGLTIPLYCYGVCHLQRASWCLTTAILHKVSIMLWVVPVCTITFLVTSQWSSFRYPLGSVPSPKVSYGILGLAVAIPIQIVAIVHCSLVYREMRRRARHCGGRGRAGQYLVVYTTRPPHSGYTNPMCVVMSPQPHGAQLTDRHTAGRDFDDIISHMKKNETKA